MTDAVVAARKPSVSDAVFRNAVAAGVLAGLSNRDVFTSLDMSEGTFNVRMTNLRAAVAETEGQEVADKLYLKRSARTGGKGGRTAGPKLRWRPSSPSWAMNRLPKRQLKLRHRNRRKSFPSL